MSGFVRTIEKRILRKLGYARQTQQITADGNGAPRIVRLGRGEGEIINRNGEGIGRHWPHLARGATRYEPASQA